MSTDRWEWIEHLVPIRFARVLWDSLFPKRFRALVLGALDGTAAAEYARPLTFCLGCWLLGYAAFKTFPGSDVSAGMTQTLSALPVLERREVVRALGLDSVPIPDTGPMVFDSEAERALTRALHAKLGKRFGRIDGRDAAQYFETHGQPELGLRIRGYLDRVLNRGPAFTETLVVMFVVFGLLPGWWASHLILAGTGRSFQQTRSVHMYNDSWLVVFFIIPFAMAEYSQLAFDSAIPAELLIVFALAALLVWVVRTVWLFRATHRSPIWRIALAHLAGVSSALGMAYGTARVAGRIMSQFAN